MMIISAFERPLRAYMFFVKSSGRRQNGNCLSPAQGEFCRFAEAPTTYEKHMRTGREKTG